MENSIVDQRLFYLMLSIAQGQEFATNMGFSTPSKDVADAEMFDIASRWALFVNQGIAQSLEESAIWMLELLEKTDRLATPKEELIPFLTAYGMSLINRLLENGRITIIVDEEALGEWKPDE